MDNVAYKDRIAQLKKQLDEQAACCEKAKELLSLAHAEALQKQFELTQLNNAGFFMRRFGHLQQKKEAAWVEYQRANLALEQAKLDLSEQNNRLAQLKAQYQAIFDEK